MKIPSIHILAACILILAGLPVAAAQKAPVKAWTDPAAAWPRITVRLNGVSMHEGLKLAKDFTTSAPITKPLGGPEGPIFLRDHGNPVVFRNIWILPRK